MASAPGTDSAFAGRPSKLDPFLDRIGVLPDKDVAKLAGVSPENVRTFRNRRNIPAIWRGETAPGSATAPGSGTAPASAAASAKPSPAAKASGKAPAKASGKAATKTAAPVAAKAPASTPAKAKPGAPKAKKRPGRRATRLDPFRDRLGIDTDRLISELAGTSIENVRAYRKRHGIAARWQMGDAAPASAPTPAAPAPSPRPVDVPAAAPAARRGASVRARQWAYRVTADVAGESREYVTFGDDVVDAAEKARNTLRTEHASAFVTRIEVVGVAL